MFASGRTPLMRESSRTPAAGGASRHAQAAISKGHLAGGGGPAMAEHRRSTAFDPTPAGTPEPALPDGVWSVAPQGGEIGSAVKEMWGLRTVRGVFGVCAGSLKVRAGGSAGE